MISGKNFHSNSPVRLKKSLWESRTTATLATNEKKLTLHVIERNSSNVKQMSV
jgi:hypothetical protein